MSTIASQLFRAVVPAILFALVTGGLVLDLLIAARLENEFDDVLAFKAEALMSLTEIENGILEVEDYTTSLTQYADPTAPEYFVMLGPSGDVLAHSPSARENAWLVGTTEPTRQRLRDVTLPDGRDGRAIVREFVPIVDDRGVAADAPVSESFPVTLFVAVSREALDELQWNIQAVLVGTGIVLIAVLVVLARQGIRTALEPLEQIGEQIARLDPVRLDQRLSVDAGSLELDRLAIRFNELLHRLDTAFARERQFSADVAHELRTPLAELRSLGEISALWPDDPDLQRGFFADHTAAVARMERTVATLLALARSESRVDEITGVADLVALIRRTVSELRERAAHRNLVIAIELPHLPFRCVGQYQWEAIVGNLLDNAVSYATPGTTVVVTLEPVSDTSTWRLAVANMTHDLEAEDLPLMSQRMWRKDSARSSELHSGLGLALVASSIKQLALELKSTIDADGSLTLSIVGITHLELPVHDAAAASVVADMTDRSDARRLKAPGRAS